MSQKERRRRRQELEKRIATLRAQVKDKREREKDAKSKQRAEELADQIDAAVSELRRIVPRYKKLGRQIKRHAKKMWRKRYYASEHFMYSEFDCNDGTKVPKSAYPALRHLCKTYLEPVRKAYGPVHINSGFRTDYWNDVVGGEENSVHRYDLHPNATAADIRAEAGAPSTVANHLEGRNPGGLGRYASFVHVDNRQRIGWPRARWTG